MSFDFSGPFHFPHFFSINLNITLCFMHFYFKIKRLFNFDENNYVHHPHFSFPPIFLFYTKNKNINLIQLSYHHNILLHHLQSHIKVIRSHGAKDKVTKPPKISLSFIMIHTCIIQKSRKVIKNGYLHKRQKSKFSFSFHDNHFITITLFTISYTCITYYLLFLVIHNKGQGKSKYKKIILHKRQKPNFITFHALHQHTSTHHSITFDNKGIVT